MIGDYLAPFGFYPAGRGQLKNVTHSAAEYAHIRSAQLGRCRNNCIEHSLQVESGAADDFKNVGCRRKLLQRLVTLAG
jgi:hypothetical protein